MSVCQSPLRLGVIDGGEAGFLVLGGNGDQRSTLWSVLALGPTYEQVSYHRQRSPVIKVSTCYNNNNNIPPPQLETRQGVFCSLLSSVCMVCKSTWHGLAVGGSVQAYG